MRIYLPLTPADLAAPLISPRAGFVADERLEALYAGTDWEGEEELSDIALTAASLESFKLGAGRDPRLVASCDVEPEALDSLAEPGEYRLRAGVEWERVRCVHVDEGDGAELCAALRGYPLAQVEACFYATGEVSAEGAELSELCDALVSEPLAWYDESELAALRGALGA